MAEHGTTAAYRKLKCRCGPCRKVWAEYMRENRRARMAKDPEAVLAAERAMYYKHRATKTAKSREYYKAHKDTAIAASHARYHANLESEKAKRKAWREANPEKVAAAKAEYYRANREKLAAYAKAYREANRVKIRARQREWTYTERGKASLATDSGRRRGVPYTDAALEYIRIIKADPCSYCGGPGGTVDHIEPVTAGGTGEWDNLAGACLSCNAAKNNRSLLIYLLRSAA